AVSFSAVKMSCSIEFGTSGHVLRLFTLEKALTVTDSEMTGIKNGQPDDPDWPFTFNFLRSLLVVAILAAGRTGFLIGMAALADLVRHILAETLDLPPLWCGMAGSA